MTHRHVMKIFKKLKIILYKLFCNEVLLIKNIPLKYFLCQNIQLFLLTSLIVSRYRQIPFVTG